MVRIRFQELRIGAVSDSSGVFSGHNVQSGYKHTAKWNQAFGTVSGKRCSISDIRVTLDDNDGLDTYSTGKPPKT
jgi:hypothetical protein